MTRQHFVAIADAFARARRNHLEGDGTRTVDATALWEDLRRDICDVCASTNPAFDRARFIAATKA